MIRWPRWSTTPTMLTAAVSLWCLAILNLPFWGRVLEVRPMAGTGDAAFLVSLALLAAMVINLFLTPLTLWRPLAKPLLAFVLVLAASASYFSFTYGVFIDKVMIRNVFATDTREAGELVNLTLLAYVGILGLLPALAVLRVTLVPIGWRREILQRSLALGLTLLGVGSVAVGFYQDHASLLRNHRELRHLLTPVNVLAGIGSFTQEATRKERPYEFIGTDATLGARWNVADTKDRPLMLVVVIGETARAQEFSLDGYVRETNPKLAAIPDLINFPDVSSCGTSTAISVPCMFSDLGRSGFDAEHARSRDNLLNILDRSGFDLRWYGNNTDCRGVCRGIKEIRAPRAKYPQLCEDEHPCRDGAIFQEFFESLPGISGKQVVFLHMLGSHGPGYHLRYPSEFERFTPVCRETDFSKCRVEDIINAYDNTLLYTDHLLAETIGSLRGIAERADVAMIYLSDHGESLGENGIFLHALPYAIAPEVQTQVPMLLWGSTGFFDRLGVDSNCVAARRQRALSHDHLFHSVLGLLDVQTSARRPQLDLFEDCKRGL